MDILQCTVLATSALNGLQRSGKLIIFKVENQKCAATKYSIVTVLDNIH